MKLYQTLNRLDPYLHAPEGDVRVAEGSADDPDADLVRPRRRHLHLLHLQRLPRRLAHRRCAIDDETITRPAAWRLPDISDMERHV